MTSQQWIRKCDKRPDKKFLYREHLLQKIYTFTHTTAPQVFIL
jgi:hypothetical protein